MKPVYIGKVPVGDGHPTVFMAELGTFFNKDVEKALKFIDLAVEAGAPVVKTEILHDPNVCYAGAGANTTYNHAGGSTTENYRTLIERKVVSLDNYQLIIRHARSKNVPVVASIYDPEGVDFFVSEGGSALKLWRNNLNNLPLIKHAAKTGLPIIFDAAFMHLDEVMRAVRFAMESGAGGVIVNHHPGKNPAPASDHNLRVLQTYKDSMQIPVGLSCHYRGDEMLYAAVGAGVNLIEKGVFDNPDENEQNVITAASFNDLKDIIRKVHLCWEAMGSNRVPVPEKRDRSLLYGLVTRKPVKAGEKLSLENVRYAFPQAGISVEDWDKVEGTTFSTGLAEHEAIDFRHLNFNK